MTELIWIISASGWLLKRKSDDSKFCYFLVFIRWWRQSQLPAEKDTSVKRRSQKL